MNLPRAFPNQARGIAFLMQPEAAMPSLDLIDEDTEHPYLSFVFSKFLAEGKEVPELYRALANAPQGLARFCVVASR